jgi:hypothetical protein
VTAPRPAAEAALAAQARRRRRAARHAAVLGGALTLLAVAGVVSAGAATGRWELPLVDEPERAPEDTEPVDAGPQAPVCGPDGTVEVAAPADTELVVRNGTSREGLAGGAAEELVARGFVVTGVGNTQLSVGGASQVRFPPQLQAQALAVAVHSGAPDVLSEAETDGVVLTLGPDFAGLRPTAEVDALLAGAGELFQGCLAAVR